MAKMFIRERSREVCVPHELYLQHIINIGKWFSCGKVKLYMYFKKIIILCCAVIYSVVHLSFGRGVLGRIRLCSLDMKILRAVT